MNCLAPVSIKNPQPLGTQYINVPCGKCGACLINRRNEWSLRLSHELKYSKSAHFLTLTYDDENIFYNENGQPSVNKRHIQLFMKLLRRKSGQNNIRYYAVGEYGTNTHRPHYHLIIFNLEDAKKNLYIDSWKRGFVKIGSVTDASIHYVCKYHVNKSDYPDNANPSFTLMSRKPALGAKYVADNKEYYKRNYKKPYIIEKGGVKRKMPRYYKDKIYSKEQKQFIAKAAQKRANYLMHKQYLEHKIKNPNKNFFELQQEQKLYVNNTYKEKSNLNNTF